MKGCNDRLIILGIDALDPKVVGRELHGLPNLKRMSETGMMRAIESVFPPDSIPAWATIFTGLDPSQHGLVMTPDVFESSWMSILNIDAGTFKGRTFWDRANRLGKRVFIWMPLGVFPPWEVDGSMICRSFEGEIRTYPESLLGQYDFSNLELLKGNHPGNDGLLSFSKKAADATEREIDLALEVSGKESWDLAFFFISSLDIIQHFFWRYYDKSDPTHRHDTELSEVIPAFYRFIDSIIGRFEAMYEGARIIVISDHGHGMRPPTTVNINEVLRRNGLLKPRGKPPYVRARLRELARFTVLETAYKLEMESQLLKFIKKGGFSRESKNVYLSEGSIDTAGSQAYLSTFAGPKSYPTGGIHVRSGTPEETAQVREGIRRILEEIKDPITGQPVVKWVRYREEVFLGENASKYPEVLFMLEEKYGVYWSVFSPIFQIAYEHHLASGGHKMTGVVVSNSNLTVEQRRTGEIERIQDAARYIIDSLQ